MSSSTSRYRKQYITATNGSFDIDDDFEDSALYVLDGLKDVIKKATRSKKHAKMRQYCGNSDYCEDYCDTEEIIEEKEPNQRKRQYLHGEEKHIQKVHKELCDINSELQHESKRLRIWEAELQKREARLNNMEKELSDYAGSVEDVIQKELKKRHKQLEEDFELKIKDLNNDNKKLRISFKIVRKAHDTYKSTAETNEDKVKSYEQKQTSMKNRISNLQRKIEILNQQLKEQSISPTFYTSKEKVSDNNNTTDKKSKEDSNNNRKIEILNQQLKEQSISPTFYTSKEKVSDNNNTNKKSKEDSIINSTFFEMFGMLLQWVSDVHLKQNVVNLLKSIKISSGEHDVSTELTNEKCMKIIIALPTILPQVSTLDDILQLSFLRFIYWSMFHAHLTQSSQKFSHAATYRRIGEELYQGKANKSKDAFFKSQDCEIRVLSTLLVLYTVTQADILANAFQTLNADLRQEQCKSYFIEYRGTFVLHPLFKLTNKINLSNTTDILMVMATESPFLQAFLESLSCVEWIQALITVMKNSQEDEKLMEKLSLLLQRLLKLRPNKPIMEALQVKCIISEFLHSCSADSEFLQLNLRSILSNIG